MRSLMLCKSDSQCGTHYDPKTKNMTVTLTPIMRHAPKGEKTVFTVLSWYLLHGIRNTEAVFFYSLRGVSHTVASNDFGNPKSDTAVSLVREKSLKLFC